MDRARLSPGNCPCLSSGQTRVLQSGRPLERRPAPGMGLGTVSACELSCSASRAGCVNENGGWKPPVLVGRRHAGHSSFVLPIFYGDLFGEAVADAAAEVAAAAAGDGSLASAGFALINSTSKMSVAFGPISPPVPPGP